MGSEGSGLVSELPAIEFAGPEDARLLFFGPPRRLAGSIPLINNSAAKQSLRSLEVSGTEFPLKEIPFNVRLSPGEKASVRSVIALDPSTAPGTYELQLRVGSRTVPATLHVEEVVDLRIEPRSLTILAGADGSYTKQLTFYNAGNVALHTGNRCEEPIFETADTAATALAALHKADKKSIETMLRSVLEELGELSVGPLIIKRDRTVLRPGRTEVLDLEFELPAGMKPERRYRANLQLYNAPVAVEIYTTAKIGAGKRK
jgi:hypothetical protein